MKNYYDTCTKNKTIMMKVPMGSYVFAYIKGCIGKLCLFFFYSFFILTSWNPLHLLT